MHACMHVMYVCVYVCVRMYVCMHACMHACMHVMYVLRGAQLSFQKFCGASRAIFGFSEILMDLEDSVGFGTILEDLGGFGPWRAPGGPLKGPWRAPGGRGPRKDY